MKLTPGSTVLPRWTRTVVKAFVPCVLTCDAILGDLHVEFARDVRHLGRRRAHADHRTRVLGIVGHAMWDSLWWRNWLAIVDPDATDMQRRSAVASTWSPLLQLFGRARRVGGHLGFTVLAFAVIALGVVVNTTVFTAVETPHPLAAVTPARSVPERTSVRTGPPRTTAARAQKERVSLGPGGPLAPHATRALHPIAFGVGGLLFLLTCATVASGVMCVGPRWRCARWDTVSFS